MVADSLVYHPTVAHYVRFVGTTVGRDKVLRTLQYLARFLSWYLLRKGYSAASIEPWEAMKKAFGSTRKVMRVGKNVEHLKAAGQAIDSKTLTPTARYLTAGRQLGYFFYLTLDSLSFLDTSGIYRLPATLSKRVSREALRCWMIGLIFSLINSAYTLQQLAEKEKGVKKTEPEGRLVADEIARERKAVRTQATSDVCDVLVPLSGLGWVALDDGVIGLAGLVSSWIGLKAAWKKTA